MILRMFLFEVRYWLRQPMVYIFFFILALLTFGATSSEAVTIGGGVGNVLKNAPFVVYTFYGIFSFLALLMVTAFVNGTAIRDFANNTSQIVFSTPVSKPAYLVGKFLGSAFVASLPLLGVSLGIVLGSAMPWVDPLRVGPNLLYAHAQGFLIIGLPNILFTAAIIFAVGVLQRSTMASFITAIVLFVGYSIAGSLMEDMENQRIASMLDPFGATALGEMTQYWTVDQKNHAAVPFHGLVLWNRVLWIGVAAAIFLFGYLRFSFSDRKQKAAAQQADATPDRSQVATVLPSVRLDHSAAARRAQFFSLFLTDLKGILRSTPFIIIMVLGVFQLIASLSVVTSMYGNTTYPVTYAVVDLVQGSLFIYLIIIVTFYAGQLIWKERDPRIDGVVNALPMATRTPLLAKFTALMGVVLVVLLFAVLAGMITQLGHGYTRLQPMVYLTYYLVPALLSFTFFTVLAMLVHVLVNNKYLGFFVFILVVVLNIFAWNIADVESNLVVLNGSPGLRYSDMNGVAPFLGNWAFFRVYWMLFTAVMLLVAYFFVVRGNDTSWSWRWRIAKERFRGAKPLTFVLLIGWLGLAAFGYYQTKVVNSYVTEDEQEDMQVTYERTYKRYASMPQPHYTDVTYSIDLDPARRSISYTVDAVLKNKSAIALDTVWFSMPDDMDARLDVPGGEVVLNDTVLDQRMYRLSPPLAPGAELHIGVAGGWHKKGIQNATDHTTIVQNGSFFNNMELLPTLGYNEGVELSDKADRRKHGLPPNERMPELTNDPEARMHNYLMKHSDWVNVRTTISTASDQIAIAPGSLKKEWVADGKRYFSYELDHPALNFYSFLSARYEVAREKWQPATSGGQAVDLEVYYQKEHAVNVPRMLNSMRKSLEYYTTNFGPYRHKQARIIEFPRYASFAQAFPGTMPYSESIGFITDLTADEDIDMVFYVVAHEMGHQWWAHQVIGADMQGSTLLSESMAQYSALMVMEREYGRDHMRKFLKYESDKYLEARGNEAIGERPLLRVENQGYIHYNKASVVLYALRDFVGDDTLNKAFRALVDSFGYAEPPWPTALDMYRELEKVTPDSLHYLLEDGLEHITVYSNSVTSATAKMNPDSTWTVDAVVRAKKVHADSLGRTMEVPMNDWLDIAVERKPLLGPKADKSKNAVPLLEQRVRMRSGENRFTFVVPGRPLTVVIDRDHLFFDDIPDDNKKRIE